MSTGKTFTYAQVAEHASEEDCWMVINGKVYDVTKFLDEHPGGPEIVVEEAGKDATEAFEDTGHSKSARQMLDDYYIGDVAASEAAKSTGAAKSEKKAGSESSGPNMLAFIVPLLVVAAAVYLKVTGN